MQLSPRSTTRARPGSAGPSAGQPQQSRGARRAGRAAPGEGSDGYIPSSPPSAAKTRRGSACRSLEGHYGSYLANHNAVIRRVNDPSKGTFYQVEVRPMSSAEADALCNDIKSNGGQCVPRYDSGLPDAFSFRHDLVRKPVPTFRDHALSRGSGFFPDLLARGAAVLPMRKKPTWSAIAATWISSVLADAALSSTSADSAGWLRRSPTTRS